MMADAQSTLQLRDIHLPAEPGWWPPAPGWWLVCAMVVAALVFLTILAVKRYRVGRARRRILSALAQLETDVAKNASPDALARISTMLRRIALTRYPRTKVAALTGDAWLRFLDESGGNGRFRKGPGRVLASGPYQRTLVADLDVAALSALVREWVAKNMGARRES